MAEDNGHPTDELHLDGQDQDQLADATAEGVYEICKAFADVLRNEKVLDAAAAWLNSHAKKGVQMRNPTPYYVGLVFGLLIFAGIGFLAWHKAITPESTTVLIGALIAAWWGGQRQQPQK